MSGVSCWSSLIVTWYFSNYRLLLIDEQIVWLHVKWYDKGRSKIGVISEIVWAVRFVFEATPDIFGFLCIFFSWICYLKRIKANLEKYVRYLYLKFFKSPFCKLILSWFCRFCPTRWIDDQPVAEQAASIWKHFTKAVHHWEGLCKSLRPTNKSYETLVKHYRDPLVPIKLQFFAFIAGILKPYLTIFQANRPLVPFMCDELMKILDQLLRLIFRRNALEVADTALKKLKKKWLADESRHLEDGLVDLGAATKDLLAKTQVFFERKRKFKGEYKKIVLNLLGFFSRKVAIKLLSSEKCAICEPNQHGQRAREKQYSFQGFSW